MLHLMLQVSFIAVGASDVRTADADAREDVLSAATAVTGVFLARSTRVNSGTRYRKICSP